MCRPASPVVWGMPAKPPLLSVGILDVRLLHLIIKKLQTHCVRITFCFVQHADRRLCLVSVPPALTKPNGKQCPGCYSLSPFGCETETVDCVGAEDFCLDLVEEVKYGNSRVPDGHT